jgi:hypothetical protein
MTVAITCWLDDFRSRCSDRSSAARSMAIFSRGHESHRDALIGSRSLNPRSQTNMSGRSRS